MTTNDTASYEAETFHHDGDELTWRSRKEWGSEGNTHRTDVHLSNGDVWTFTVDQPHKGYWTARGWLQRENDHTSSFKFYREGTTLKALKAEVRARANLAARTADLETSPVGEARPVGLDPATLTKNATAALAQMGVATRTAARGISKLVRALIAAQPCGCPTPVHRMSCPCGAVPRVIKRGA